MPDIKSIAERSLNMAAIKNKNTKPEMFLRHQLFSHGYRYRICCNTIPGHPDIWMKKYNTAIFVNGCFWHRHRGCKYAYVPKSRYEFWQNKFFQNIKRDEKVKNDLEKAGIRCLIVWECTIKQAQKKNGNPDELFLKIKDFLDRDYTYKEL